jgi:hypothetical protein
MVPYCSRQRWQTGIENFGCCLRVLCYRNRTLPACGRLIVPGPRAGFSSRVSRNLALRHDRNRLLRSHLSIEDVEWESAGNGGLQVVRVDPTISTNSSHEREGTVPNT